MVSAKDLYHLAVPLATYEDFFREPFGEYMTKRL
jgi:hypothetical protein